LIRLPWPLENDLSQCEAALIGSRRVPPAKKVLFPGNENEKEKRGELESAEHDSAEPASQSITNAQAKLQRRVNKESLTVLTRKQSGV
jgi:hypothetical protein